MKHVPLLEVAPFARKKVESFDGIKKYLSTGNLEANDVVLEEVTYVDKPSRADIIVEEGDVLFAKMINTDKVLHVTANFDGIIVSTGFSVHKPKPNILSNEYLVQFLKNKAFQQQKDKYCTGAIQSAITNNGINKIKIPLPPIFDQIRIAAVLSKADALIAQRKESLRLLDELLKSTFMDMFGDPDSLKKQQMEKLGSHIDFMTSGSRGWAQYYSERGKPFLRIQNVGRGRLILDDMVYVNPPITAEAIRTRVQAGDLLISITADLGRTAIVPESLGEAYINQHLALIRLKEGLNPVFAAFFYAMPFGYRSIQKKNREGVKAGLNFDDLKSLPIYCPDPRLQTQFVQIVEKVETLKAHYKASLKELENLYGSLSQRAFKGELVLSKMDLQMPEEKSKEKVVSLR